MHESGILIMEAAGSQGTLTGIRNKRETSRVHERRGETIMRGVGKEGREDERETNELVRNRRERAAAGLVGGMHALNATLRAQDALPLVRPCWPRWPWPLLALSWPRPWLDATRRWTAELKSNCKDLRI